MTVANRVPDINSYQVDIPLVYHGIIRQQGLKLAFEPASDKTVERCLRIRIEEVQKNEGSEKSIQKERG